MVAKKPDCIGQKFGRLTVISKAGRCPRSHQELWLLRCDCGNKVERTRNSFDRKNTLLSSCGCARVEANQARAINRRKPDCTGQKFGRLFVLGLGSRQPDRNSFRQLWKLQCDCGKVIERTRSSFENKGQISCGCARSLELVDSKRRPYDITGQRFGNLTAIALTGKKNAHNKPTWRMLCDCGNTRLLSLSDVRMYEYHNIRINCKDRNNHPEIWLEYPPTPNPYPKEAGELLAKYLHLTELDYSQIDSEIEDEKRDRLLRAAWIITYRRQQGEEISELLERRIINKHLRYCSIDVFWRRKLEKNGGFLYNANNKKEIGDTMTNATSNNYPVIETQGIKMMCVNPSLQYQRRTRQYFKFRRC